MTNKKYYSNHVSGYTNSVKSQAVADPEPEPQLPKEYEGPLVGKIQQELLYKALECGLIPFIIGPRGCGKTSIARHLAQVNGMDFYPFDVSQAVKPKRFFFGGISLSQSGTDFFPSEFYTAYQSDKPTLIFLDEITRIPLQAANTLMTVLDANNSYIYNEDTSSRIYKSDNVMIIVAGNIGSEYRGTSVLDAALFDRFVKIPIDYLSSDLEYELFCQKYRNEWNIYKNAKYITDIGSYLRRQYHANILGINISTRCLEQALQLLNKGVSRNAVCLVLSNNYLQVGQQELALTEIAQFTANK